MTVVQLALRSRIPLLRSWTRAPAAPLTATAALLLGATGILLGAGLIMILSSSWVSAYQRYGSSFWFFQKQLLWAALGVTAMIVAMRVDYRRWRSLGWILLLLSFIGLVLVLHPAIGTTAGGSSRWLGIGALRVQPSELAKLALVLVAADVCTRKARRLRTLKDILLPLGIIAGVFASLVMLQPDLGTTVILGGIVFATIYVGGARLRIVGLLGATGVAAAGLLSITEGYRRARLMSFINPFSDPLNTGYQAVQAQIALGSGGLFGVGLGASRQKWMYVPNAHTDFIFAIIGEEAGLLGTFAVIALVGLLGYAGVRTARRAPDTFGRVVAGGITAWIVGQAVINMGAVTGLLPITGVPLPLVSFGGSSLLFTLIGIGILINIAKQEVWPPQPAVAEDRPPRARPARRSGSQRARTSAPRTAGPRVSGPRSRVPAARARPHRAR